MQFFFSPEENKRGDDMSKSFEISEKNEIYNRGVFRAQSGN